MQFFLREESTSTSRPHRRKKRCVDYVVPLCTFFSGVHFSLVVNTNYTALYLLNISVKERNWCKMTALYRKWNMLQSVHGV